MKAGAQRQLVLAVWPLGLVAAAVLLINTPSFFRGAPWRHQLKLARGYLAPARGAAPTDSNLAPAARVHAATLSSREPGLQQAAEQQQQRLAEQQQQQHKQVDKQQQQQQQQQRQPAKQEQLSIEEERPPADPLDPQLDGLESDPQQQQTRPAKQQTQRKQAQKQKQTQTQAAEGAAEHEAGREAAVPRSSERHAGHEEEPPRAAPPRLPSLELPWPTMFTEEELARGISYYGSGARWRRAGAKLLAGQAVSVVLLGGSITAGAAWPKMDMGYGSRLFQWINGTFPHTGHRFLNQGYPASSTGFAAPCLGTLVPDDADLVVVEYTVNDSEYAALNSHERRAYEHLVRRLLAMPAQPAVVLLHAYAWWRAAGDGRSQGLFYKEPEGQFTALSHYYDVPSLSLRAAAWRLLQAGVDGFKVDKTHEPNQFSWHANSSVPQAGAKEQRSYFYRDVNHPGPNGHKALAELVVGLLRRGIGEAAVGLHYTPRPLLAILPPPMQPAYQEDDAAVCLIDGNFEAASPARSGFEYRAEKPGETSRVRQKWGYVGSRPGAPGAAARDWLELEVDTSSPKLGAAAGNATVHLSFLRGWQPQYADAAVACVAGCACEGTAFSTWSEWHWTLFVIHLFEATRHPRCRVRVTVYEGATPREEAQGEAKVMLNAIMVTQY